MSNSIEEDISVLEKYINFNEICGTGNFKQAIENILEDRKRLQEKANKYDRLINRIKEEDKEIVKMKVEGDVFKTAINFARNRLQELLEREREEER